MAVFRAVENKRSLVRSTNGGITCIIDPNGRVLKKLDAFVEAYLLGEVPVLTDETTLYTRWGDWMGIACIFITLAGILLGTVRWLILRRGN